MFSSFHGTHEAFIRQKTVLMLSEKRFCCIKKYKHSKLNQNTSSFVNVTWYSFNHLTSSTGGIGIRVSRYSTTISVPLFFVYYSVSCPLSYILLNINIITFTSNLLLTIVVMSMMKKIMIIPWQFEWIWCWFREYGLKACNYGLQSYHATKHGHSPHSSNMHDQPIPLIATVYTIKSLTFFECNEYKQPLTPIHITNAEWWSLALLKQH